MKKPFKRILILIAIILFVPAGCLFYGFQVEPYLLKVDEQVLTALSGSQSGIKIAQISDLHIKEDFTYQQLKKVTDKINALEPDFVLFTGDLYDNYASYHDDENVISQLQRIKAKYQKIAVWGNRDYGGSAVRQYEQIMDGAGFILLKNESLAFVLDNQKTILFTGLDDSLLGNPSLPETSDAKQPDYSILLSHEPDVIERYTRGGYDIAITGHSHGGQVKLPFARGITTALGEKYTEGLYRLGPKDAPQLLYVNTGIGTTRISCRFRVVPEIALFDLSL